MGERVCAGPDDQVTVDIDFRVPVKARGSSVFVLQVAEPEASVLPVGQLTAAAAWQRGIFVQDIESSSMPMEISAEWPECRQ